MREATLLLLNIEGKRKCKKTPLKVRKNLSFLVDVSGLKSWDDVKGDMNGTYSKVLRIGTWTLEVADDHKDFTLYRRRKSPSPMTANCTLTLIPRRTHLGYVGLFSF